MHLSAVSSDIGLEQKYFHKNIVGGTAILTFGLWSSKVTHYPHDLSDFGSYLYTTIQGKGNKKITFTSAYIAVMKGSNIGVESMYAQQMTLHKRQSTKKGILPFWSLSARDPTQFTISHNHWRISAQTTYHYTYDWHKSVHTKCYSAKGRKNTP